jgi:hypothetical protein
MASPDGHGRIVYADGCVVHVYPGTVATVQEGSCKVAKPMMLGGTTCDPKELNCPPAVPGTPFWVYPAAAVLIGGAMRWRLPKRRAQNRNGNHASQCAP